MNPQAKAISLTLRRVRAPRQQADRLLQAEFDDALGEGGAGRMEEVLDGALGQPEFASDHGDREAWIGIPRGDRLDDRIEPGRAQPAFLGNRRAILVGPDREPDQVEERLRDMRVERGSAKPSLWKINPA